MKSEGREQGLGPRDFAPNCWMNQRSLWFLCFPTPCTLGGSVLYDGDHKCWLQRETIAEPHKSVTYRLYFVKVLSVLPSR